MKKLFAVLAAATILLLPACASVPQGPANAVYAAHLAYDAALSGAVFYKELPSCPRTPPCKDPAVVATIQQADKVAFEALSAAQKIVREKTSTQSAVQMAATWAAEAIAAFSRVVAALRGGGA